MNCALMRWNCKTVSFNYQFYPKDTFERHVRCFGSFDYRLDSQLFATQKIGSKDNLFQDRSNTHSSICNNGLIFTFTGCRNLNATSLDFQF